MSKTDPDSKAAIGPVVAAAPAPIATPQPMISFETLRAVHQALSTTTIYLIRNEVIAEALYYGRVDAKFLDHFAFQMIALYGEKITEECMQLLIRYELNHFHEKCLLGNLSESTLLKLFNCLMGKQFFHDCFVQVNVNAHAAAAPAELAPEMFFRKSDDVSDYEDLSPVPWKECMASVKEVFLVEVVKIGVIVKFNSKQPSWIIAHLRVFFRHVDLLKPSMGNDERFEIIAAFLGNEKALFLRKGVAAAIQRRAIRKEIVDDIFNFFKRETLADRSYSAYPKLKDFLYHRSSHLLALLQAPDCISAVECTNTLRESAKQSTLSINPLNALEHRLIRQPGRMVDYFEHHNHVKSLLVEAPIFRWVSAPYSYKTDEENSEEALLRATDCFWPIHVFQTCVQPWLLPQGIQPIFIAYFAWFKLEGNRAAAAKHTTLCAEFYDYAAFHFFGHRFFNRIQEGNLLIQALRVINDPLKGILRVKPLAHFVKVLKLLKTKCYSQKKNFSSIVISLPELKDHLKKENIQFLDARYKSIIEKLLPYCEMTVSTVGDSGSWSADNRSQQLRKEIYDLKLFIQTPEFVRFDEEVRVPIRKELGDVPASYRFTYEAKDDKGAADEKEYCPSLGGAACGASA